MDDFKDNAFELNWQSIVERHSQTLRIPSDLISPDPALSEWLKKANHTSSPPSETEPGPSFHSLITRPETAAILDRPKTGLPSHDLLDGKDSVALVSLMKHGIVSVEQVTRIFLARSAIAHQATGCLSHFFAKQAIETAKQLDHKRQQLDTANQLHLLGPLFGLPMSIKGFINYKGSGSQRGFVYDVLSDPSNHPLVKQNLTQDEIDLLLRAHGTYDSSAQENGHIVQLLIDADAIIIGKTTMPQGIMQLDTKSNLYGQTLNPLNLALSPGGSSGGESALIAADGVTMGVGTDIGGSIRQPCGVCNIYGLRPTTLRIPTGGFRAPMPGNLGVTSSAGPLARSLRDIDLFMSTILDENTKPWEREHNLVPIPWRKVDSLLAEKPWKQKLTVGVMLDDGVVRPTAPVRRALEMCLTKLQQWKGNVEIQVKIWQPKDLHVRNWDLIRSLYFMDSGKGFQLLAKATGEPLLPLTQFILSEPYVRSGIHYCEDSHSATKIETKAKEMTVTEEWVNVKRRETFKQEFHLYWNEMGIDCLLCPVMATVAPRPGKVTYWGYTSTFNLVDYPGVVFPSGVSSDSTVDGCEYPEKRRFYSELDRENSIEYGDHCKVFDGAPVGLQLIGKRYHDEQLIKYAELLEHVLVHSQADDG